MPNATASASTPVSCDERDGLVRIGQVHLAGAMAVLDPAERADLALDRDAARVGILDDLLRDRDVVVERRRGLAVCLERAVHHHAREAEIDRGDAGRGLVSVIEVERDGDLGIELDGGLHQVPEEAVVRVRPGAARRLDDHGRGRLTRCLHDRLDLLHVVDVEGPDAVAAAGGFVEELAHRDERHGAFSLFAVVVSPAYWRSAKEWSERDGGGTIREMFLLLT